MVHTSFKNWIWLDRLKLHFQLNSQQPVTSELFYATIILHGIRMSKIGLRGFVIRLVLRSFWHEMLWTAESKNHNFSTLKISILLVRYRISSKPTMFERMDPLYTVITLWATDCPIELLCSASIPGYRVSTFMFVFIQCCSTVECVTVCHPNVVWLCVRMFFIYPRSTNIAHLSYREWRPDA